MILISTSLMTSDVEHLLLCLLTICLPSLEKYLLKTCLFLTRLIIFYIIKLKKFFIYFRYKSLIGYVVDKHFLLFMGCLFTFFLKLQKTFYFQTLAGLTLNAANSKTGSLARSGMEVQT